LACLAAGARVLSADCRAEPNRGQEDLTTPDRARDRIHHQ
jgi:hypothetical protein